MSHKKPEFSFNVLAEEITKSPHPYSLSMSDEERDALCERLEIKNLDIIDIKVILQRLSDGCTVSASGHVHAKVTQECVVTLDDVVEDLKETIEGYYLDEDKVKSFDSAKRKKHQDEDSLEFGLKERRMPELHEEPEPIRNGRIDIGELVTQHIALGINPYPHKEEPEDKEDRVVYSESTESPFAKLSEHITQKKT